jgi:hypothetical protein
MQGGRHFSKFLERKIIFTQFIHSPSHMGGRYVVVSSTPCKRGFIEVVKKNCTWITSLSKILGLNFSYLYLVDTMVKYNKKLLAGFNPRKQRPQAHNHNTRTNLRALTHYPIN